jgi:hypothetical protein
MAGLDQAILPGGPNFFELQAEFAACRQDRSIIKNLDAHVGAPHIRSSLTR